MRATPAGTLLLAMALSACAEPDDPEGAAPPPTDALVTDSAAADSAPGAVDDGAPPIPSLPGEGAPRQYRLRLVNLLDRDAFVFASAGAGRVVVDTVPGADSTIVDIRLRSDHVTLEARDPSGRVVKSEEVDLDRSVVNRWEIVRSATARTGVTSVAGGPGDPRL